MQFHRPVASYLHRGILQGYSMRYRCVTCQREAIIPTPAIMVICAGALLIFGWVVGWLLTGDVQTAMQEKPLRVLLVAIGCPIFFLVCLHLLACGLWNRRRFPIVQSPAR